ncbi:hypothetical protein VN97_g2456 [Penicillium thymicola]|uniref:Uncharacterized protein n=1 Tax=Penicillium thymicola TaxID=293382 RepID=A0AAI9TPV1_PENTH|nr:hypothetical protein VN97_g2456 [Penicillium thymicola]
MEDKIREYYHRKDHNMTHRHRQIVSSHAYHLDLYLESVILILYRPFLLEKPEVNSPSASANEWRSNIERKMRAAAMSTNGILGNMASADMISSCQSMICIALVPTLQIYLVDSTSTKSLVRRMGIHNLELCMVVIEELKTTYFGAEILFRMFTKAQSQVRNRRVAAAAAAGKDVYQPSSNADAGIVTDVADGVYPNNMEVLDVFSVAWNPFAQVAANGFLDNNEYV